MGFVRGTNSDVAKVKANAVSVELVHSTDWLPTLSHLANLGTDRIKLIASPAATDGGEAVSFQWKNPVFLLKNPGFLVKRVDFIIKGQRDATPWRQDRAC